MTELVEQVAIGLLEEEIAEKCPFSDPAEGVGDEEREHASRDDSPRATMVQKNNGGVLGTNLMSGSPGKDGTVGGPYPPPKAKPELRQDTLRTKRRVRVPGTADVPTGTYGFTVAAHHLIPGEAALAPSKLKSLMTKGGTVKVIGRDGTKKSKKVRKHIGYNVNGAHNGVWLPGNYYVRSRTSPIKGKSWSALGNNPWCRKYVAAVVKVAEGQMHDAHTKYSAAVEELLNKIAALLMQHECDSCKANDINPPFRIKSRLYAVSAELKNQVTSAPMAWKRPWFTSDRWRDDAFDNDKPSRAFMEAYNAGRLAK
jgi:hypothetical protein